MRAVLVMPRERRKYFASASVERAAKFIVKRWWSAFQGHHVTKFFRFVSDDPLIAEMCE